MDIKVLKNISSKDIAKYFLLRANDDGELVSPLKMQKLVYYAYVWTLVRNKKKLFREDVEAWANGPVVASLYQQLKKYGSSPISEEFLEIESEEDVDKLFGKFPEDILETLDEVYQKYMTKTAFELVLLTHSEKPWLEARKDLAPHEQSNNKITVEAILQEYSSL